MSVLFQLRRGGRILAYEAEPGFWFEIDNNPATSAIADGAAGLYQLHNDGSVFQYTGSPIWPRLDNNPDTIAIVAFFTEVIL